MFSVNVGKGLAWATRALLLGVIYLTYKMIGIPESVRSVVVRAADNGAKAIENAYASADAFFSVPANVAITLILLLILVLGFAYAFYPEPSKETR